MTDPNIFDLLEPLARALERVGGPDIRSGFARETGGVDIPFIIGELVRKKQQSSDMVERVARLRCFIETRKRISSPSAADEQRLIADLGAFIAEASHHAELVEALKLARRNLNAEPSMVPVLSTIDALLTKIGEGQ